jgi:membrane protease YdiL (CAAX protease family)
MEKQITKNQNKNMIVMSSLLLLLAFIFWIAIDRVAIYLTDIFLAGSFGYVWLMLHHAIQIVFAVAIMILPVWQKSLAEWGFTLKNHQKTLEIILKFSIGWIICTTIFTLVTQWLSGWPPLLDFYFNWENLLSYLIFESIIVGISEEIVFRGLVYGVLMPNFKNEIKLPGFSISYAAIISAIFFSIAHIGFQIIPFSITTIAPMQVFVAFTLGVFYAVVREKTGSLLGPILAHNISDGWLSILYIIIQSTSLGAR